MEGAGRELGTLFKDKMVNIKGKMAEYFAKLDIKIQQNNQEVAEMSQIFKRWQR